MLYCPLLAQDNINLLWTNLDMITCSKYFYYALKCIKVIICLLHNMHMENYGECSGNIHLEQCRDYAWTQHRIKDVIRAIRT